MTGGGSHGLSINPAANNDICTYIRKHQNTTNASKNIKNIKTNDKQLAE